MERVFSTAAKRGLKSEVAGDVRGGRVGGNERVVRKRMSGKLAGVDYIVLEILKNVEMLKKLVA